MSTISLKKAIELFSYPGLNARVSLGVEMTPSGIYFRLLTWNNPYGERFKLSRETNSTKLGLHLKKQLPYVCPIKDQFFRDCLETLNDYTSI